MIYTSNFTRCGNDPRAVSIALYPPNWYKGKEYRKLMPPKWLIDEYHKYYDIEMYTEYFYSDILSRLNACQVIHDLYNIGDDVILLCWESASEFCHRFLVSEWLNKQLNITVEEYIDGGFF